MIKKRHYLLIFIIGVLTGLISTIVFWRIAYIPNNYPEGRIIFQSSDELFLTDGNGNHIQYLGGISGISPSWSPDGDYIAAGCQDGTKICVYDANTIVNWRDRIDSGNLPFAPKIIKELDLPFECLNAGINKRIYSISWSFDGKRMSVICQDVSISANDSLCILPLEGATECWDETTMSSLWITHAVWSPKEYILAISGSHDLSALFPEMAVSKVYLVDPGGKKPIYLVDGWIPEWSPDGQKIAFVRWGENQTYPGIAVINRDGTDFHWVYKSPIKIGGSSISRGIFFGCGEQDCRLAWSPDGQYIAFSGSKASANSNNLFRLALDTGNIIELLNPLPQIGNFIEPDWGP